MLIKKVFNNNALLAEDNKGHEVILLGKGVGFSKKAGDKVDQTKVQKRYIFDKTEINKEASELFKDIPIKHIDLSRTIFNMAQEQMKVKLDHNILVGLTDHISYAIKRYEENQKINNVLLWDIKKFYPFEFKLGMIALDMIYYSTNLKMDEDEAGFIAMHFVNAQYNTESIEHTARIAKMVEDILQIVEFHYQITLDKSSLPVLRFVTHIRFFGRRLYTKEIYATNDHQLYNQLRDKYPHAYRCTIKVKKYLATNFNVTITNDEFVYFMLHINNVYQRERGEKNHE
ncbi:PRD domain-containing protein [Amphibacillus sp. MSJ-3]|uniref:BglG family transcription antiterminator LicT n=1 Tax=Amphibacillus sp. MSJ-3 TaxID=2841505 RepID=UPI001C0F038C|nr:PRD domain-containing protein [Amphibacillus sp. MSJ-3]MBU5594476.1 PRD domain-containing protein [Amphibacillus sp. MSJ-3]